MKKILVLIFSLLFTAGIAAAQDAEAIINRYYQITGLDKIDPANVSATTEMEINVNGQSIKMMCAVKLPSKLRIDMQMAGQPTTIVFNGDKGSVSVPGMPVQPIPAEQMGQFQQQANLLSSLKWNTEDYTLTLLDSEEKDGKICDVVKMVPKNKEVPIQTQTLWFDRKSGLIDHTAVTVTTPQGDMEVTAVYKNYVKSGTFTYPSDIESQTGAMKTSIHISKYEIDVPIPDTLFIVAE